MSNNGVSINLHSKRQKTMIIPIYTKNQNFQVVALKEQRPIAISNEQDE